MLPPLTRRARARRHSRGERSTRDVLARAHRRGQVLGWANGVTAARGQGMQLVLTTAGPLALYSTSRRTGADDHQLDLDAAQALDHAQLASTVLATVGSTASVLPVVVIWGRDQRTVPRGGRLVYGVLFLRGGELKPWLRREMTCGSVMEPTDARRVLTSLSLARSQTGF